MQTQNIINKVYSKKIDKRISQQECNQSLPAYDMSLINSLENDHEEILELFNKVLESAKNEEFRTLQLLLVEFATSFTDHIHIEDEILYGYLKILASNKSDLEQKIVSDFSSEMKNISISIFDFLTQSPFIPVNETNIHAFIIEFESIGMLLQDRIEREETVLYPIYENSNKVVNIS